MNFKKFLLSLTLIFVSGLAKSQFSYLFDKDVQLKENQADTISFKLDSILIVGAGASGTRIFLNDVTDKLIGNLEDKKIKANYFYLGKTDEEANKAFKLLDKRGYKAVLIFKPMDTAYFATSNSLTDNSIIGSRRTASSTTVFSSLLYQQTFSIQLLSGVSMKKFWSAKLDVDCDPAKKNAAKNTVKYLMARFKDNKYFK